MLVICDQCQAKYKIRIKKHPGKPVKFKCGKCQNLIRISPDQIDAEIGPDAETAHASPPTAETVEVNCLKCGSSFIRPAAEKSNICYQCRIDALVSKVKDKYGVGAPQPEPEAEPSKYTIRSADGLVLGPIKLRTVSVLAREKRIKGVEEVSKDGSEYKAFMNYPELAELFPELKEIMDTTGLDDKVDEAFMSAFGGEEEEQAEPLPGDTVEQEPEPPPAEEASEAAEEPEQETAETAEPEPAPDPEQAEQTVTAPEEKAAEPEPIEESAPEEPETEQAAPPEPEPDEEEIEVKLPEEPAPDPEQAGQTVTAPEEKAAEPEPIEEPAPEEAPPAEPESEEPVPSDSETPAEDHEGDEVIEWGGTQNIGTESKPETPAEAEGEPPEQEPAEAEPDVEEARVEPPLQSVPDEHVGTEFDVGEEWDDEEEEEEIIEDLTPLTEPHPDARYRIRYPDGLILGPVKLATIKELFETGNLTGQEEVQREDDPWAGFAELPELAELVAEGDLIEDEDVIELTDALEESS